MVRDCPPDNYLHGHPSSFGKKERWFNSFLKPGARLPTLAWFLEIVYVCEVGMRVCVCVCPSPRLLKTSLTAFQL